MSALEGMTKEEVQERLTIGITKALDIVMHDYDERVRLVEEDLARLLRHSGLGDTK